MNRRNGTWVMNIRQKLEDICIDIDEFVSKEPVSYMGSQMETVGANMRNFFSGFVDEFGFTQEADPSKCVNPVKNSTNTIVCDTNNLKEAASGQITSEIGQHLVIEKGGLLNKSSDSDTQVNNNNRFEDRVFYDESVHSDATGFEYSDWGIENIFDLDLNIDNIIEGELLMNLEEKKTDLNKELKFDLNTSITHQSSELESSITCNENQEENSEHIIAGGLSSEKLNESLNSSLKNFTLEPETNDCNPTEIVDDFSVSSCGSFTTVAYDSNNEADVSCSGTGLADGVTVDFEDAKKWAVNSSVISGKLSSFPKTSRSKSYKKMIQDAFMSRKRLTKEYKQLAILYGDIDTELCQPTESHSSNIQLVQDGPDSEWELL